MRTRLLSLSCLLGSILLGAACETRVVTFGGGPDGSPSDGLNPSDGALPLDGIGPFDGINFDVIPSDGPDGSTPIDGGIDGCAVFAEICNGIDDNCNGMVDEGFDKATDPNNCGQCGHVCRNQITSPMPHASATCVTSACALRCEAGFMDADHNIANGCEYGCTATGVEVCDGHDNDCDNLIDAADPDLVGIANFCETRGECNGARPACTGGAWVCAYNANVQTTGPNQIIPNETKCDGKDNDCDGCIDEPFPQVGLRPAAVGGSCTMTAAAACADTGVGACRRTGTFVCNSAGTGTSCNLTSPVVAPSTEICDGVDNNCDGTVDNATGTNRVIEPMVAISGGGVSGTKYIYAYEAARPDANGQTAGTSTARACAKSGAIPWINVSYPEAVAACAAAGKRLCTKTEWQRACQTSAGTACTWSFASSCTSSNASTCNTQEYDTDGSMGGNQDTLLATGALPNCYANWGTGAHIHDMSGNAKEWVQGAGGVNPLQGGSFNNILPGAICNDNFTVADDTFRFINVGFRCCSDSAP